MSVTIYGIRTCDTMRKARAWLEAHAIAAIFHDYRKDGVSLELIAPWVAELGWQKLLNRSGTTFRRLPDADKADLTQDRALDLMLTHPALIRRPVLMGESVLVGFSPESYATFFGITP